MSAPRCGPRQRTAPSSPSRRWRRSADLLEAQPPHRSSHVDSAMSAARSLAELRRQRDQEPSHAAGAYSRAGRRAAPRGDRRLACSLAGHQPELFHPGVWVKNFALPASPGQHGAVPLNLSSITTPSRRTACGRLPLPLPTSAAPSARPSVLRPRPPAKSPYEERAVRDEALFATLPGRSRTRVGVGLRADAAGVLGGGSTRNADRNAPAAGRAASRGASPRTASGAGAVTTWRCRSAACARRGRSPVSRSTCWPTCRASTPSTTPASTTTAAVTASAAATIPLPTWPRRRLAGSAVLGLADGEAPAGSGCSCGRRRRIGCCDRGHDARPDLAGAIWPSLACDLRAERSRSAPAPDDDAVRPAVRGRPVRPRHRRRQVRRADRRDHPPLLRLEPPGFLVLSGTLRLPLPTYPTVADDLHRLTTLLRDMEFNPQRYLARDDRTAELLDRRGSGSSAPPTTPAGRLEKRRAIRQINEELGAFFLDRRQELESQRDQSAEELRANTLLRRRRLGISAVSGVEVAGVPDTIRLVGSPAVNGGPTPLRGKARERASIPCQPPSCRPTSS